MVYYPPSRRLIFPLKKYSPNNNIFGRVVKNWGVHLGEDVGVLANTEIKCICNCQVVYSALHLGGTDRGNWGGVVIVEHKNSKTKKLFYSLYGHLGKRYCAAGDQVKKGGCVGLIGQSYTAKNGWWPAHLHFAIYIGPWNGVVLPGYLRPDSNRTKREYWRDPREFINKYNGTKT